ncbi:MAG: helix-turn-helix transcriptional regulator, partial [Lentisphaeria bacterium]
AAAVVAVTAAPAAEPPPPPVPVTPAVPAEVAPVQAAAAPQPVAVPAAAAKPAPKTAAPGVGGGPLTPKVSPIRKPLPLVGKPAAAGAPAEPAAPGPVPVRVTFAGGRVLREHREKAGLDIPGLSQKTKVPKEFIENLEANRLEALPPPVYAKSYLRLLCREFGLDPAACLEEYNRVQADRQNAAAVAAPFALTSEDRETGAKVGYAPRPTQPKPEKKSVMLKKPNPALIAAGVVVVGLVLVGLIAFAVSRGSSARKGAAAPGATAAAGVELEKFITPQQLPMKELPVPGR